MAAPSHDRLLREVEFKLRDARHGREQMAHKVKMRSTPDPFRGLHDTYLAQEVVLSQVTAADARSVDGVVLKLESLRGHRPPADGAADPEGFEDLRQETISSLVDHFRGLR